jgi:hypothetical protein
MPSVMLGASPLDRREHSADPPAEGGFPELRNVVGILRNPQIEEEGAKS